VAEDLEALSRRVKARVEQALETTRERRRRIPVLGGQAGKQQSFDFEREEMRLVRQAARRLRKELANGK
jgi:hypothetical protein